MEIFDEYVQIASSAAEEYIRWNKKPVVRGGCLVCDEEHFKGRRLEKKLLEKRAGVYVTIMSSGKLRGQMGTLTPACGTLAEEIIRNTISAAVKDMRFAPIQEHELSFLTYCVDILGKKEHVYAESQLNPSEYGIVVTKGYRRAILLPEIAMLSNEDNPRTAAEQIALACRKADIDLAEQPEIERFPVSRHIQVNGSGTVC